MDTIRFTIPGKPEYLTMVRLSLGSVASMAGFDVEEVDDMKNAISEACKNVSCHGSEGFSNQYEVEFQVGEKQLIMTVKDDCEEHTLKKIAAPCMKCPQEGDLGLFVMESLVDELTFSHDEKGHKMIRMVKTAR